MGRLAGAPGRSGEVMDIGNVTWRKASYSGDNGGGCVEVGAWRKRHSGDNGGACVEVASTGKPLIAVRDSKDPNGPKLAFTPPVWRAFIRRVRNHSSYLAMPPHPEPCHAALAPSSVADPQGSARATDTNGRIRPAR